MIVFFAIILLTKSKYWCILITTKGAYYINFDIVSSLLFMIL